MTEVAANDGGTFFEAHYSPIKNYQGEVSGLICTSLDITAHKQAERELADANHRLAELHKELEERVAARTIELQQANENLEQNNRLLMEANFNLAYELAEHQRIEQALEDALIQNQQQKELLENLIQNAPLGIAILQLPDFRYLMVNPYYEEHARGKGPLVGRTIAEVWPEIEESKLEPIKQICQTKKSLRALDIPVRVKRATGIDEIVLSINFIPLLDHARQVSEILLVVQDTTEQAAYRKQIEEERNLLNAVFENAPEGILVVDRENRLVRTNPAAEKLYGRSIPFGTEYDQVMTNHITLPDGSPISSDQLPVTRSLVQNRVFQDVELATTLNNGQTRSLLINAAPIHDQKGAVNGAIGIFQDITLRKRIEKHALFLNELGRAILCLQTPAEIGQMVVDQVSAYLRLDRCFMEDTDLDRNQITISQDFHRDLPAWIGEYKMDQYPAVLIAKLKQGQQVVVEDTSRDALTQPFYTSLFALIQTGAFVITPRIEGGRWVTSLTTITQVPRIWQPDELSLLQSVTDLAWLAVDNARLYQDWKITLDRFKLTLKNAPIIIYTNDRQLRYTWADNPQQGIKIEHILGKRDDELMTYEAAKELIEFKQSVLDSGIGGRKEIRMKIAGMQRVYEMTAEPLYSQEGVVDGLTVAAFDITERKILEEQMENAMLRLERSNHDLEDFAFIASHHLQEPLRKVILFGDRLRRMAASRLTPDELAYLRRMQESSSRMSDMLHDLLEYSSISIRTEETIRIDLLQAVQKLLGELRIVIENSGASIEIGDLPVISAGEREIHQILLQLIDNALKFHRPGIAPVIKISGKLICMDTREWVQIRVEDNGIGMEEHYLDRIFKPFQRLHGQLRYDGNGMGLAICYKIVIRHGGKIDVQSKLGEGSTFIVSLPIYVENAGIVPTEMSN